MKHESAHELVGVVDELLSYVGKLKSPSALGPALERLRAQAIALCEGQPSMRPIERQHIELAASDASALLDIVARLPRLEQLFGTQPSEKARMAFGTFLSNVHSCVIGPVFRGYPELVLSQPAR